MSPARVANISAISTVAKREGLAPRDLTTEWFAAKSSDLPSEKRGAFQSWLLRN